MILFGGKIFTATSDIIENGYIKITDGKIEEIGSGKDFSADANAIDVTGKLVFPGFIDAHCHLGMWEDSLGFEGSDGNEDTDPSTPHLRAIDAINPMDRGFEEAVRAGVTTVVTGPGSANPISGTAVAIKTLGSCIDDMVVCDTLAVKFALGENPKSTYHSKGNTPVTRMAIAAIIREQLVKAQRYLQDIESAEEDADMPEYDIKCESLIPVLRGEVQAHFHAHRADDIFTAIRISEEFGLNYKIIHATDGHLISEKLSDKNAEVVLGPIICDRSKPELSNQEPFAAAKLSKAGVKFAICTDHPEVPIKYLPLSAAIAVSEGLSKEEALKAITINAAEICGLDKKIGSIEVGKDADFAIFDIDPFEQIAKPTMVIVGGKVAYE